jgi:uncharacterized membrane protein YcaP (DUF421 family)
MTDNDVTVIQTVIVFLVFVTAACVIGILVDHSIKSREMIELYHLLSER